MDAQMSKTLGQSNILLGRKAPWWQSVLMHHKYNGALIIYYLLSSIRGALGRG